MSYLLRDQALPSPPREGIFTALEVTMESVSVSRADAEEAKIREGVELRFEQLLDALPVAAYTCDRTGLITHFNARAVELWGRTPTLHDERDRWCGSFRLFDAKDGSPITPDRCWMALAILQARAYESQEIIIERPDGLRVTVLAHANPIRDRTGQVLGAVNILVDITGRKRAEETNSRLGAIVESSDDAIIGKTLDGRIVSWNAAAERIFGYTAEEAVGQSIGLIIPEERWSEEQEILAKLRRGERVDHYETVRVTKDGQRLDISLTSSPIRDASGRIIGASKVARNITLRKRNEEAFLLLSDMSVRLATSLDGNEILRETLRTALLITGADQAEAMRLDTDGSTLEVTASINPGTRVLATGQRLALAGSLWEPCVATRRSVLVPDVSVDPAPESVRALAGNAGFRGYCATPLSDRKGRVIGVLSLQFRHQGNADTRAMNLLGICATQAADFLENARLYAELKEADRAKNDFLAILAHELRNPLAPIRNTVAMLSLSQTQAPELRSALGVIDRQLGQMTRLIDDLLDVARITQNRLELRRESRDIAEVLHAAVESSRPLLTARGHDFGVDLPPEPVFVDADLTRLAQVIANLLNNAAKYTDRGGRIRLTSRREGDQVTIRVRDNGIGIPKDAQGRIFEKFAQVDRSIERSHGGLGIGLHLARRLTELHGGTLTVNSEGPGRGSEFVVQLPQSAQFPAYTTKERERRNALPAGFRILVVDDNRDAADSLGQLLVIPGNDVRVTYDGERAVEVAAEFEPEVVLLDIGLPKLNGYETARRIRQQAGSPDILLIALTGWGQEEARQRSREAGFDFHFVKPVDPVVLMRKLSELRRARSSPPGPEPG
jgi:PAS domain S-box-containing protein